MSSGMTSSLLLDLTGIVQVVRKRGARERPRRGHVTTSGKEWAKKGGGIMHD